MLLLIDPAFSIVVGEAYLQLRSLAQLVEHARDDCSFVGGV